jgi:hypothetical protein
MKRSEIVKIREEAIEWAKNNPDKGFFGPFISRTCWVCNPAHDYLKNSDYPIQCFDCGKIYFKGVDITITKKEERLEKLIKLNEHN